MTPQLPSLSSQQPNGLDRRSTKALVRQQQQASAEVALHDVAVRMEAAKVLHDLVANRTLTDAALSLELDAYSAWRDYVQGDQVAAEILGHRLVGLQGANDQALQGFNRRMSWGF